MKGTRFTRRPMLLRRLLPLLFLSAALTGCNQRGALITEPYPFENAPTKHRLNLARLLDDELLLASADDTLRLKVRFEPEQRTSLVLDAGTGDTLLHGWVTRFRGHFYVTEPRPNGTYWIHAWRRNGKELRGLLDGPGQMLALTLAVDRGRFAELTRLHAADSTIRLHYDAQLLRPFFEAQVDSSTVYRRLKPARTAAPRPAAAPTPVPSDTAAAKADTTAAALIRSVYPNPAREQVTVASDATTPRIVQLLSLGGQVLRTQRSTTATTRLDLNGLPAGGYLLQVREDGSGRTASQRLVVQP